MVTECAAMDGADRMLVIHSSELHCSSLIDLLSLQRTVPGDAEIVSFPFHGCMNIGGVLFFSWNSNIACLLRTRNGVIQQTKSYDNAFWSQI